MQAENFTLKEYFARIGYTGIASADTASVTEIMRCQLFSVPFENLDVQSGKGVSLVPEEIVEKIVHRRRGGYCYEVNGLFAMALSGLAVSYRLIAARPMTYPVRRPKTHMTLVVEMEGRFWLCDLGFGSFGIRAPLRLDILETPVRQDDEVYMLSKTSDHEYLLKTLVEGVWCNQYSFDLSSQEWIDFVPANYLNSTHPDAIFVQKLLVVLHRPTGRDILFGDLFTSVHGGQTTKRTIQPTEREAILTETFGLAVPHLLSP